MTTLSINEVPEEWVEALRKRALGNHRSLQAELKAILEEALHASTTLQPEPTGLAAPLAASRALPGYAIERKGRKTIEQIAQEHRVRFIEAVLGGPLAVNIIREDRDAR